MNPNQLTGQQVMHHYGEASRLRCRAAACLLEAEFSLWLARGCPMDRSGVLGVSLFDLKPDGRRRKGGRK